MSKSPKIKIILVRHAQSEWNQYQKIQGHLDSKITEHGYKQIQALISELANEKITKVYSSTSGRAIETAQKIAKYFQVDITTDPLLLEQHFGVMQGLSFSDAEKQYPTDFQALKSGHLTYPLLQGESSKQAGSRLMLFLNQLTVDAENNTVCIVSHGHSIAALISILMGEEKSLNRYNMDGCAYTLLSVNTWREIKIERWGVATHLLKI